MPVKPEISDLHTNSAVQRFFMVDPHIMLWCNQLSAFHVHLDDILPANANHFDYHEITQQ